jgi:transcription antitermination factor NusG
LKETENGFTELFGGLVPGSEKSHWYVIYTKPRREKKLAEYAFKNNIHYYLPLVDSIKFYERKKVVYTKPMFTSYLFVKADPWEKQQLCISGHTVSFLNVKDEQSFLEELRYIYHVRTKNVEITPHHYLEKGTKVRFTGGPLKGVSGLVADSTNIKKVILQVNILKRAISVTAESNQLEIINDHDL